MRRKLILAALLLAACGQRGMPAPQPEADVPAVQPTDYSVYELESDWRDQRGQTLRLERLGGRVQVLAMVYTECSHTCPAILAELKRIESGLAPADRERVGFVFVSLDPARDTPERLAAYAAGARLDPGRWTLLSGDDASVRELAALLAVRYRGEAGGEISHSNTYFVLDPSGRIVHRQNGLHTGLQSNLTLIRALAAGRA